MCGGFHLRVRPSVSAMLAMLAARLVCMALAMLAARWLLISTREICSVISFTCAHEQHKQHNSHLAGDGGSALETTLVRAARFRPAATRNASQPTEGTS